MRWSAPIVIAIVVASSLGCTTSTSDHAADPVAEDSDLTGSAGTTLRSPDSKLTIVLDMVDGATPRTRNRRFSRAKIVRPGGRFSAWCDVKGETVGATPKSSVYCSKLPRLGQNEEWDDQLVFWAAQAAGTTTLSAGYVSDRAFFEEEADVLFGEVGSPRGGLPTHETNGEISANDVPFTVIKQGTDVKRDPYALAAEIHATLAGLVGQPVDLDGVGPSSVTGYDFTVSSSVSIHVRARFGSQQRTLKSASSWVSLLSVPGDLSSGIATRATILGRVKAALGP